MEEALNLSSDRLLDDGDNTILDVENFSNLHGPNDNTMHDFSMSLKTGCKRYGRKDSKTESSLSIMLVTMYVCVCIYTHTHTQRDASYLTPCGVNFMSKHISTAFHVSFP